MTAIRPMSEAPLERIEVLHFERGWLEVTPDHEANYWLPERTWQHENDEGHGISEGDLEGWRPAQAPSAQDNSQENA